MRFLIPVLALVLLAHVPAAQAQGCSGSQGSGPVRRLLSGGLLHRGTSGGLFARRHSRSQTATVQATTIQVDNAPEIQLTAPAPKAATASKSWKPGPMPAGTWNWGAVVTKDTIAGNGFYFADFMGDHVMVYKGTFPDKARVEAADVLWFNNSIELPPR